MKADQPLIKSEEKTKMFRWPPKPRTVREREEGWVRDIWRGDYPTKERREKLKIGGKQYKSLTYLERVFMIVLLWGTYLSLSHLLRKFFINKEEESQLIEIYAFCKLLLMLVVLCLPIPFPFTLLIAVLVFAGIAESLVVHLRVIFVDRYSKDWALYSYNRSLILLFLNYFEMVIGFAYVYLHFTLVGHSDCGTPIATVWEALYFSVVTITTLGYGDMHPISCYGRFFAALEPIMGIVLLILVLGLFFVEIGRQKTKDHQKQ